MRVLAFPATLVLAMAAPTTFDDHLMDAEGGKSLLIVTPAGESMIDPGWPAGDGPEASAALSRPSAPQAC